jgi:hypothetical protein
MEMAPVDVSWTSPSQATEQVRLRGSGVSVAVGGEVGTGMDVAVGGEGSAPPYPQADSKTKPWQAARIRMLLTTPSLTGFLILIISMSRSY